MAEHHSGKSSRYMSAIEVNLIMSTVTKNHCETNFPRELITLIMHFYHNLRKVRLILGTGDFSNVGAGIQDQSLFIIDTESESWVSLPYNSNGYIIHSPDAKAVSAWCGSPDYKYKSPVLRKPSGEDILCVNDSTWDTIKSQFQTWKYWKERDGIFIFSAKEITSFADPEKTKSGSHPDTYRVTIDCNCSPSKWFYVSHGGEVPIIHDGINPMGDIETAEQQSIDW